MIGETSYSLRPHVNIKSLCNITCIYQLPMYQLICCVLCILPKAKYYVACIWESKVNFHCSQSSLQSHQHSMHTDYKINLGTPCTSHHPHAPHHTVQLHSTSKEILNHTHPSNITSCATSVMLLLQSLWGRVTKSIQQGKVYNKESYWSGLK